MKIKPTYQELVKENKKLHKQLETYSKIKEDSFKLKETENRLSSFINSVPDIICYKDGAGKWLLANDADLDLFCLTNVDYFGKTDAELAKFTDPIYKASFLECMKSDEIAWKNKIVSHDIEIIPTVKGINKIYDVFKIPTFHKNGERKGLAVIGRDITELKNTEELLINAKEKAEESDKLKTEFIQNISHEIRTPMNAILGFTDILNKNLSEDKFEYFTNIIKKNSNQLLRIIDDIIEISVLGTKQVKVKETIICLNELLLEHFSYFDIKAKENKIALYLKRNFLDEESLIWTDETKLNKILSNLLENAIKFTPKGFVEFGYKKKNNKLEIYVKDTGIGIKVEEQKKIFERFSKGENELFQNLGGLGLGLAIIKENVDLLGGEIILKSKKGKGSLFLVTIPYKTNKLKI